jgi:hypothetical protein
MCTHKGKQEVHFEYSLFEPMLVKCDGIDQFLIIGDVAPLQVPPVFVAVATPDNGATMRTAAAISATATTTINDGTTQPSIPHFPMVNQTAVTPSLNPFPTTNEPVMNANTTVPQTNLTLHPYLAGLSRNVMCILTRVLPNESGDCPASESDSDGYINQGTSGYCDPLIDGFWGSRESDETHCPWKANA